MRGREGEGRGEIDTKERRRIEMEEGRREGEKKERARWEAGLIDTNNNQSQINISGEKVVSVVMAVKRSGMGRRLRVGLIKTPERWIKVVGMKRAHKEGE